MAWTEGMGDGWLMTESKNPTIQPIGAADTLRRLQQVEAPMVAAVVT